MGLNVMLTYVADFLLYQQHTVQFVGLLIVQQPVHLLPLDGEHLLAIVTVKRVQASVMIKLLHK